MVQRVLRICLLLTLSTRSAEGQEYPEVTKLGSSSHTTVRKLDLSHLGFSLNFYFSYVSSQFPSMFPLLTYSQLFFFLIC